jgi:hypothetical protein
VFVVSERWALAAVRTVQSAVRVARAPSLDSL